MLSGFLQKKAPWWSKVVGSFEDAPTFDEAVRLGQEWRILAKLVALEESEVAVTVITYEHGFNKMQFLG